ncbi:uncharacterized protein G2W53_019698 [Senna tora]|uniref:Uncharacterized protein n=1 Tax=Senna tora TaxID=362788 RepID=A0A834TVG3_9FABA|nr:uncharacterized protein G2W53_019698 [Senna tora]
MGLNIETGFECQSDPIQPVFYLLRNPSA